MSLTIVWVSWGIYTPILQQTPNLIHCLLAIYHDPDDNVLVDVALPHLESLLLLVDDRLADTGYLQTLVAPALRELQVSDRCLGRNPLTSLASFVLKSGCKLQRVHITGR
ncbi:hypothetical protein C8R43DRAFT_1138380 [Mycena crocata]|nr:hypothetical protein C8R43DRAFT_1138380 [Mycena crocata]